MLMPLVAVLREAVIPEARMIFVSLGTGGAPTYRIETLDAGPGLSRMASGIDDRLHRLMNPAWANSTRAPKSSSKEAS